MLKGLAGIAAWRSKEQNPLTSEFGKDGRHEWDEASQVCSPVQCVVDALLLLALATFFSWGGRLQFCLRSPCAHMPPAGAASSPRAALGSPSACQSPFLIAPVASTLTCSRTILPPPQALMASLPPASRIHQQPSFWRPPSQSRRTVLTFLRKPRGAPTRHCVG